jgi:ABC-type transport system involved in cytochrome c biogenesis permease subunit
MYTQETKTALLRALGALTGVVGVVVLVLTYVVFKPLVMGATGPKSTVEPVELPAYDDSSWHRMPTLHSGRAKPFESAAIESLREITGRSKFEGKSAVSIVLSWWIRGGAAPGSLGDKWEDHAFIACDNHELRKVIYGHLDAPTYEQLHDKYISPADLRQSPGLERLLREGQEIRRKDPEKGQHQLSPEQAKAEEVANHLLTYDQICGRPWTELNEFILLRGELIPKSTAEMSRQRMKGHPDPIHLVALDMVPGSAWFSLGEMRHLQDYPDKWALFMQERVAREPQRYLSPECKAELHAFQQAVRDGTAEAKLDELKAILQQRADRTIQELNEALRFKDKMRVESIIGDNLKGEQDSARLAPILHKVTKPDFLADEIRDDLVKEMRAIIEDRNRAALQDLSKRAKDAHDKRIPPEHDNFQMLNLNYMENLHAKLYVEAVGWQKFPVAKVKEVLASFKELQRAYDSDDPTKFAQASREFQDKVRDVSDRTMIAFFSHSDNEVLKSAHDRYQQASESGDTSAADEAKEEFFATLKQANVDKAERYPGFDTIGLELAFNRVEPFKWAWVIMFLALGCFIATQALRALSSARGALASRITYGLGFGFFAVSMAFQLFGFFTRVYISGRPPVSNMYETVIWVSAMSCVFALVLELIYRRNVIILAGTLVSTIGLVLADQLPIALDPKISPLTPVLRSQFWLIIHVLTIVSSYAGGTLAWGLANVALALLAFGSPSRELVKTLSHYTYRAMQIAVLLLAAGTFLGGWWAAYSWGRFWGWDPKEVWALIALVTYVVPLHMRFVGWVKDFGLAVSAVLCYSAIVMCWYGVNFVLGAGLHSYGFGGGGPWWVFWAGMINVAWVLVASMLYIKHQPVRESLTTGLPADYAAPASDISPAGTAIVTAGDGMGIQAR